MLLTEQWFQRFADPAAIRARQVGPQDRLVDLTSPARVPGQQLAPELCRFSRFLVSHAGSWHPELASSHRRRHATGFGSVAISTAVFRTLVATTPQRLVDFFLEHDLDCLQYPLTQPKLDELPVLAYRLLRYGGRLLHGVILLLAFPGAVSFCLTGGYAILISTGSGTDPSLETSILKALCLTINTAGSELKYKILDSLSDDDFYFPVTKAVFRTLSEMHLRGDYVISANMEEELQEAGVELSSDFSMEVVFGGSLPALSELNQWVVRLKERSRTGMIPTVKPPAPAAGSGRAPDSTPNAHPTVVRSVAEVKQRIAEEARKSSPAVRPASKLAQSSPAVAAPRPAPPPSDPPRSKPAIASKPAPSREASSPSTPSTQAKRPQKAVLSSEGDDWASYMDDLALQQGKTFDIGFARLDEGLGGLGPGLMLFVDENKERLFSFLKQVTDQFASGSTMRCLYVASQLPKAALRVRTLSRLAAVPTRDIEKGRLKKDSPEWKRIDAEGRRASDWLKKFGLTRIRVGKF